MRRLPLPATGVEMYLAAILDQLQVLTAAVGGGAPEQAAGQSTEPPAPVSSRPESTKRTRQRAPRTS